MSSRDPRCLVCGNEAAGFTMKCPAAFDYTDVVRKAMPEFTSNEDFEKFKELMLKGGIEISSWNGIVGKTISPVIPFFRDALTRLMKYEEVGGARYHDDNLVCGDCAKILSTCGSCGHEHEPKCPVCNATLVLIDQ